MTTLAIIIDDDLEETLDSTHTDTEHETGNEGDDDSENESGDENEAYVGEAGPTVDPFGVSLVTNFDCMDPVGSTQISDLGTVS